MDGSRTLTSSVKSVYDCRAGASQACGLKSSTALKSAVLGAGLAVGDVKIGLAKEGEDLFVGTYNQVRYANKKTGLNATHVPHHVVQHAVSPTSFGTSLTINLRKDLHEFTRTFRKPVENLPDLRTHLARDVRNLRNILREAGYDPAFVNKQLKELIRQNKEVWRQKGITGY